MRVLWVAIAGTMLAMSGGAVKSPIKSAHAACSAGGSLQVKVGSSAHAPGGVSGSSFGSSSTSHSPEVIRAAYTPALPLKPPSTPKGATTTASVILPHGVKQGKHC